MKILLFGKNGQVGWELQRSLAPLGNVISLDARSKELCGDLTNIQGLVQTVRLVKPDIIVNAAAYTAVDKAESESELAHIVNTAAPDILAKEAKRANAWLIHYSTDYVFNGEGTKPWAEIDLAFPLNIYGKTKLAGENVIHSTNCKHLIFRTSWVYGAKGQNFAKTMLRLAQERDQLTVIDDQIGAPTGADLVADVTAHTIRTCIQRPEVSGLYHLVADGETSWHSYAKYIIGFARQAGVQIKVAPEAILPVPSSAFATAAERPKNSRLNTGKLKHTFGLSLPHWTTGIDRMLTEVFEK